eukprot:c16217_g1_i1.p1 GENE.c16217_g1_i1~~c16217_g1_i1.p1  ORF type:complete len:365 (+),score=127.07 c16217_g1_i1:118-1095(+)
MKDGEEDDHQAEGNDAEEAQDKAEEKDPEDEAKNGAKEEKDDKPEKQEPNQKSDHHEKEQEDEEDEDQKEEDGGEDKDEHEEDEEEEKPKPESKSKRSKKRKAEEMEQEDEPKSAQKSKKKSVPAPSPSPRKRGAPEDLPTPTVRHIASAININHALDKEFESKHLRELVNQPVHILQGLAERADKILDEWFGIRTIKQLANWKEAKLAWSITTLAAVEEDNGRAPDALMNIALGISEEDHDKTLKQIVDEPVTVLKGMDEDKAADLKKLHIKTVGDLGTWKYVAWAKAIVCLADKEESAVVSKELAGLLQPSIHTPSKRQRKLK